MKWVLLFVFLQELVFAQSAANEGPFYWQLQLDNDISAQTDRQYTAGFMYEQTHSKLAHGWLSQCLLFQPQAVHTGWRLDLKLFTPKDIFTDAPPVQDRPYASTFMVYVFNRSYHPSATWVESAWGIGLVGPSSQSWRLQNLIHALTPHSENAVGWKYQIADAFLLQYELAVQQLLYQNSFVGLSSHAAARLGSGFTDATVGLEFRIGYLPEWQNEQRLKKGQHRMYLFAHPQLQATAFNVTLESSLIGSHSALLHRSIQVGVGRMEIGLRYRWSLAEVELMQTLLSPEFQGGPFHSWGSLRARFQLQ